MQKILYRDCNRECFYRHNSIHLIYAKYLIISIHQNVNHRRTSCKSIEEHPVYNIQGGANFLIGPAEGKRVGSLQDVAIL